MTFGRDRALHAYTFMCNKLVKFFNSRFGRIHLSLFTFHFSPFTFHLIFIVCAHSRKNRTFLGRFLIWAKMGF